MNWVYDAYLFDFKKEAEMGRIFDDEKLTMKDLASQAQGLIPTDLQLTLAKAVEEASIKGQSRLFDLGLSQQLVHDSSATYKFEETASGTAERLRLQRQLMETPKDVLDQYCQKASESPAPRRHDDWSQEDASFHRVRQEMDCADRVYAMIRKSGMSKEDLILGLRVLGLSRY